MYFKRKWDHFDEISSKNENMMRSVRNDEMIGSVHNIRTWWVEWNSSHNQKTRWVDRSLDPLTKYQDEFSRWVQTTSWEESAQILSESCCASHTSKHSTSPETSAYFSLVYLTKKYTFCSFLQSFLSHNNNNNKSTVYLCQSHLRDLIATTKKPEKQIFISFFVSTMFQHVNLRSATTSSNIFFF